MKTRILLTVEELAKYLRIKPDTIYKKVRRGELPAVKLGKIVRFPKELIDEWITEQATNTMKEVRAARTAVEARVDKAVGEVKKAAKAAQKTAQKVAKTAAHDVPGIIEEIKKAPLNRKSQTLEKGLKDLWKDVSQVLASSPRARAPKKASSTQKAKSTAKKKSGAHKMSVAPDSVNGSNGIISH